MLVGVPREIKNNEFRVGLVPSSVAELVHHGHQVVVETGAGSGIGITDADYVAAGASISDTAEAIFSAAEMIIKVKEPQAIERAMLRKDQILFTYLHLAPDLEQTQDLVKSGAICIAYETVTDRNGALPLLAPMSEVAGRMSVQAGAACLEKERGGRGVLLGGVPGVAPAEVVILGGGIVGSNATMIAVGMGASVTVVDRSLDAMRRLVAQFGSQIKTAFSTKETIESLVREADLVIGAVLIPGAAAPKLVTAEMVKTMKRGAVVVDVAIDQGGCFETSHATTHAEPTYMVDDVVHYCVANMPGAVARTSTFALNNVTLPFALALAGQGAEGAMRADPHLMNGLNVYKGKVTEEPVAEAHGMEFVAAGECLR